MRLVDGELCLLVLCNRDDQSEVVELLFRRGGLSFKLQLEAFGASLRVEAQKLLPCAKFPPTVQMIVSEV
jgi:hypothetical protein